MKVGNQTDSENICQTGRLQHIMAAVIYKQKSGWSRYYQNYLLIGVSVILTIFFVVILITSISQQKSAFYSEEYILDSLLSPSELVLGSSKIDKTNSSCHYYSCFNVYRCGKLGNDKLLIYVYPHVKYVDAQGIPITNSVSIQFYEIIKTIVSSKYYTNNPSNACIFVPSIDTLNQNRLRLISISRALAALPFWNGGENHLLFNMLPGSIPDYNTSLDVDRGTAIIAGAGFSSQTYRYGYDLSLPQYSPLSANQPQFQISRKKRHWLLVSSQYNLDKSYILPLKSLLQDYSSDFLLLLSCLNVNASKTTTRCKMNGKMFQYPQVLQQAEFCFVGRGVRLSQAVFLDALSSGCIPVVVADGVILPFAEVLDWKRASLRFYEEELTEVIKALKLVSPERILSMRKQLLFFWERYFNSIPKIVETTLKIMNDRVFPYNSWLYEDWNNQPDEKNAIKKLSLPLIAPRHEGFTAVVLTYDRLQSLFKVIEQLASVPSLSKIVVVWNNQKKGPPAVSHWPKINKPLKVIRTPENKLSNRFYPYDEIETQAIMSIDDDIVMMTSDEIEFAYHVWREFPDRIVGFPSRVHLWDSKTQKWKYESEWTNEISMVLTGIAFYHKYYSYAYTTSMPGNIKNWVDEIMNCEDIAMNFLVSNITGKAPIKVAPRKKFKCPECSSASMMSADVSHMVERSECINKFVKEYGYMPLRTVEYRADPVLFKDDIHTKFKQYNDIGKL
ncbi:Exostosin-2 [Nymphon striatum]|nr:Exostosin-2 [Nymphon striatum]